MTMESMFIGNPCQSGLLPALVRAPLNPVPGSVGMKPFLRFPLDGGSALSIIPGFSCVDVVQKAVLHHSFSAPVSCKRKGVSCGVCQQRFNSQSQASAHYKGTKHTKKMKSIDGPNSSKGKNGLFPKENSKETPTAPCGSPAPGRIELKGGSPEVLSLSPGSEPSETQSASGGEEGLAVSPGPPEPQERETEDQKALRLLYCSLCKVAVNSASQLEAHNSGTKHRTMLEARSGVGSIKSFPRPKSKVTAPARVDTGLQNKTFHCETCDVHVNSETQLKQHISSRRHKDRAAGKPAKPKFSPYNKTQRGSIAPVVKMPCGKDLCRIMPSHLAAVATAVGSAFPLRACHSPALIQTPPLSTTLLRPAPGPIRTAHTPVLFSPY